MSRLALLARLVPAAPCLAQTPFDELALTVDTMLWMDLQGNVVTQTQPGKGVVPDLPAGR